MQRLQKPLVFALCLGPFLWLLGRFLTDNLSVNPIEDITLTTGIWALRFLVFTLAVTPIRRLTGWNRIIQYRRMLGLFAFFYASLHFLTYLVLDQYFDVDAIFADVAKRRFITVGFIAFLSMVPLAITSTKGWIRRLGKRWQVLHRLVYLSAVCGAVHYLWKVKVIAGSPVRYAVAIGVLLAFRLAWRLRSSRGVRRQPAEA